MRNEELISSRFAIKKSSILTYLLVLCLFLPSNIGSSGVIGNFFKLLNNAAALYALLNIVRTFFKNSRMDIKRDEFLLAYILFMVAQFVTLYLNHSEYLWVSEFKQIVAIVYIYRYLQDKGNTSDGITPVLYAFWTWALLDTVITILYPSGMPALANGYLLGWKNNKSETFIIAQMLGLFKYYLTTGQREKRKFKICWCIFAGCGILNAAIVKSSTTLAVMVIFGLIMFIPQGFQKFRLINMPFILIIYSFLWFLIVIGQGKFQIINDIVYFLFKKDATFTGRTMVWASALTMIANKPVLGYGKYGFINIHGNGYYYNWGTAHNQILELLMEGGLVLLVAWMILFFVSVKKSWIPKSRYQIVSLSAVIVILLSYLTEQALSTSSLLILLLVYWGGKLGIKE